jgi:2-polyprenyl-3-methyl-5-hydroxy-6-metoxy-1,4-benzoquinol methylase
MTVSSAGDVEDRARQSLGRSHQRIYLTVAAVLAERGATGALADIGCGTGDLWQVLRGSFRSCAGVDAVRYDGLPADVEFHPADLDAGGLPLPDASVDAAAAVEVIEHLENPRAFVRDLARIVRPGGWVVVTTPNQLSALSLLTLAAKGRFSAFQDDAYPAHRTALLEIDLRRIMNECGLRDLAVTYTRLGRLPLSGRHYPDAIAGLAPRWLSDNVVVVGRRP